MAAPTTAVSVKAGKDKGGSEHTPSFGGEGQNDNSGSGHTPVQVMQSQGGDDQAVSQQKVVITKQQPASTSNTMLAPIIKVAPASSLDTTALPSFDHKELAALHVTLSRDTNKSNAIARLIQDDPDAVAAYRKFALGLGVALQNGGTTAAAGLQQTSNGSAAGQDDAEDDEDMEGNAAIAGNTGKDGGGATMSDAGKDDDDGSDEEMEDDEEEEEESGEESGGRRSYGDEEYSNESEASMVESGIEQAMVVDPH